MKENKKAKKIFIRLGVSDIIIEMDDDYDSEADTKPEDINTYFVGYEDEEGNECDENGIYLN
jgi:hypothetical protein